MKQFLHASVRKCCALTLIVLSVNLTSFGQASEYESYWEMGATLGPSNFLGDLGGTAGRGTKFLKDNNFPMTKLNFGLYVGYQYRQAIGLRFAVNFGSLEGDDAIIKGKGGLEEARKIRNSNFKSSLQEAMLLVEIYPTVFLENDADDTWLKLRPYVVGGFGGFRFNPKGQVPGTDTWVELQPLRTEGQGSPNYPDRKPYKLTQLNIPLGFGIKYFLTESLHASLEILHRTTFTDYIDDVSTTYVDPTEFSGLGANAGLAARMANKSLYGPSGGTTRQIFGPGDKRGTATNNDAYYTINLKFGFRIGGGDRYGNSTRCPIVF